MKVIKNKIKSIVQICLLRKNINNISQMIIKVVVFTNFVGNNFKMYVCVCVCMYFDNISHYLFKLSDSFLEESLFRLLESRLDDEDFDLDEDECE